MTADEIKQLADEYALASTRCFAAPGEASTVRDLLHAAIDTLASLAQAADSVQQAVLDVVATAQPFVVAGDGEQVRVTSELWDGVLAAVEVLTTAQPEAPPEFVGPPSETAYVVKPDPFAEAETNTEGAAP